MHKLINCKIKTGETFHGNSNQEQNNKLAYNLRTKILNDKKILKESGFE